MKIGLKFNFETSHCLHKYDGDCSRIHGHCYEVEFEASGKINKHDGFLVDFKVLKKLVVKPLYAMIDQVMIISPYDHIHDYKQGIRNGARVIMLRNAPKATVECITQAIANYLSSELRKLKLELMRVRVYETQNAYAEGAVGQGYNEPRIRFEVLEKDELDD